MTVEVRRCSICEIVYPIEKFNRNGRMPSGSPRRRSSCKYCEQKRVTVHRKKNPFDYLTVKCNRCDEEFSVRISKPPAVIAIICESCFKSQKHFHSEKGNVTQQEADNASD